MSDSAQLPDADQIGLIDVLQVLVENSRLLLVGPLLVGLLALGIAFLIPPTFTAKVQFIPPKQPQSSAASALADLGFLGGAIAGVKSPADQYAALLKSRSVADALIQQFQLHERYDNDYLEDTRKELASNTRVTVGPKDGLITIEVEDRSPKISAEITNAYVVELRKVLDRVALTEAQQRRVFFERQVNESKANMVRAEQALKASGVDSASLKTSASAALEGVARLRAQISVQEVKIATMRGYFAETAPEFRQAQTELAALRGQLDKADKEDGGSRGQSDYIARFRDFKYQEALLGLYMRQFELARIDESREGTLVQVVDAAQPPERKSSPKRALIAILATLASGLVILLFVFARNAFRNASKDPATAEKLAMMLGRFGYGRLPQ